MAVFFFTLSYSDDDEPTTQDASIGEVSDQDSDVESVYAFESDDASDPDEYDEDEQEKREGVNEYDSDSYASSEDSDYTPSESEGDDSSSDFSDDEGDGDHHRGGDPEMLPPPAKRARLTPEELVLLED